MNKSRFRQNLAVTNLDRMRLSAAKRAFTTRRVPTEDMSTLISGNIAPESGDLVLATVETVGSRRRLELPNGRRAILFPGDEIIVCYGNRYAPDQYEAVIGDDLSGCDLVAAGGIASRELSRHDRMTDPPRIVPVGLIGNVAGERLNVRDFAVAFEEANAPINTVLVVGTSMNAGKTLTAASLVRGLKQAGHRVAAIKATGTGAGGDLWIMRDVGADVILDFTDGGYASTYMIPPNEVEEATIRLINLAVNSGCAFAIIEIADGLQQQETAMLLRSNLLRLRTSGVVFAAYDAMGAKSGVESLREIGHRVYAVSGRLARSQLMIREAENAAQTPVLTPWELMEGGLVDTIAGGPRDGPSRFAQSDDLSTFDRSLASASRAQVLQNRAMMRNSEPVEAAVPVDDMFKFLATRLIDLETENVCGAGWGERNANRVNTRNGYRKWLWKTQLGTIDLRIPKLRRGSYFPTLLMLGKSAEKDLLSFVHEACSTHVTIRSARKLLKATGLTNVSVGQMGRFCAEIDLHARDLTSRTSVSEMPFHNGGFALIHDDDEANGGDFLEYNGNYQIERSDNVNSISNDDADLDDDVDSSWIGLPPSEYGDRALNRSDAAAKKRADATGARATR